MYTPPKSPGFPPPYIPCNSNSYRAYTIRSYNESTQISTANDCRLSPFFLPYDVLVRKLVWNQSIQGTGNIDIGLYDDSLNRIVSLGATATPAVGVQESDITDTYLRAGHYYSAFSVSVGNSSAQTGYDTSDATHARMVGFLAASSSHPLPSTITGASLHNGNCQLISLKTF